MEMVATGKLKPLGPVFIGQIVGYVDKEAARERASLSLSRWHVVQTQPQQERSVADDFEDIGIAAYVPFEPIKIRIVAERYRVGKRPLLPGYVFAGFDPTDDRWHHIVGVRGVTRLFMIDFRPVPLGETEMQRIRLAEATAALGKARNKVREVFKVGEVVQIKEGPFASFFGLVTEARAKDVYIVEVDIFARKTPAEFEGEQLGHVA